MLYKPPDQWSETMLDNLSNEDDRYEFKSGGIIFEGNSKIWRKDDVLVNDLAPEICAFANSFGGTLFLGVRNKDKKIDGVSRFYRRPENLLREWLDKKIAHMLEFRLPSYRVSEVKLSAKTKKAIGTDKSVLAIDIFDSDLAPHQCRHDKKYYFRQNSNSDPAPHHYLAYLWGRTSQTQSETVRLWCTGYLNPIIDLIESIRINSIMRTFQKDCFFPCDTWDSLTNSLIADQFLRTHPETNDKLSSFRHFAKEFDMQILARSTTVLGSKELDDAIRKAYSKKEGGLSSVVKEGSIHMIATWLVNSYNRDPLESEPKDRLDLETFLTFIIAHVAGARKADGLNDAEKAVWHDCTWDLANAILKNPWYQEFSKNSEEHFEGLRIAATELGDVLTQFRYEICLRHNTYYQA